MARIILLLTLLAVLSVSLGQATCDINAIDYVRDLPNVTANAEVCMYSGFAKVSPGKNMYYWFIKHTNNTLDDAKTPILVWLNGGPGSSSLMGLFKELGPLRVNENDDGSLRVDVMFTDVWTVNNDILFIDNPVGTGFSYTDDDSLIPTNEDEVAKDLYETVQFFLKLHPETQTRDWYYSGESYAGKYTPAMTYWTLKFNENIPQGSVYVPLKGMLVGDGFTLPVDQRPGVYDEAIGVTLLTDDQKVQARTLAAECQTMIGANETEDLNLINQTTNKCNDIIGYITEMAGNILPYDVRYVTGGPGDLDSDVYSRYLSHSDVVKALNVESSPKNPRYQDGSTSANALLYDTMYTDSLGYINYIAANLPTLIYEGNMDMQDGSTNTLHWLDLLAAPFGQGGVTRTKKYLWYEAIDGVNELAGWVQQTGNLTFLTIAFSGHFVPLYQPAHSSLMVSAFTSAKHQICDFPNSICQDTTPAMCKYMNNCSGHGTCNDLGLCECDAGYGLADCSAHPEEIETGSSFVLNKGSWGYYTVDLSAGDVIVSFSGEQNSANINVYVSYAQLSTDINYDAAYVAGKSHGRKIYLYKQDSTEKAYLTIQNTNYFEAAAYTITLQKVENQFVQDNVADQGINVMYALAGAVFAAAVPAAAVFLFMKRKSAVAGSYEQFST